MKYHINREQHFFFEKNHYIEFDALLTDSERKRLADALQKVQPNSRNASYAFDVIKKITHMSKLAKLASELIHTRKLRFGFDQLLAAPYNLKNLHNETCINGLAIALYLSLDSDEQHAIFALPTMDLASLPLDLTKRYFLIVWTEDRAQYILQPKDPHTHELKKCGYVFGDRLKEEWHPIVC